MQKHMAERTATLQTAVDEMNKAKGSVKVDKMAAVINELVTQRAMMQKHMMEMQPKMMEHMMQHMHRGMMKGMSESMSGCPMMKGSDKAPSPPASEPKHQVLRGRVVGGGPDPARGPVAGDDPHHHAGDDARRVSAMGRAAVLTSPG